MDIVKTMRLRPGRYVVAVSGGVDSMALLDILHKHFADKPSYKFTVAHYDHGIRDDSAADRRLVQRAAQTKGLPFVYEKGNLGQGASEEAARRARYDFLKTIRRQVRADGIITAHHLDDGLETAVHNLLRGTGRKGMSSLGTTDGIVRPLLHVPKHKLVAYAQQHDVTWNEDSTNTDQAYRRNYIRHTLLPRLKATAPKEYERLKMLVKRQHAVNHAIDSHLTGMLHIQPEAAALSRQAVVMLPHRVGVELVAHWLRARGKRQFDRRSLERLAVAIKTARPGTIFPVGNGDVVRFGASLATFEPAYAKRADMMHQPRQIPATSRPFQVSNHTSRLPNHSV